METEDVHTTSSFSRLLLRFPLAFILAVAPAFSGCGGDTGSGNAQGGNQQAAAAPMEVSIMTVSPQTIPVTFEAVGQTEGSREVEVRARVGGILLRRHYTEGQFVKQGTLLFTIDPKPYAATLNRLKGALAQEESQLQKARRDVDRLKPLYAENAVSRKDYEDALSALETAIARVKSAEAGVTEAELNLGYTNVTASISGITGRAEKSEGSLIAAGTDLLTRLSQVHPIYARFSYSENTMLRVREEIAARTLFVPPENEFRVELRLSDDSLYPHTGRLNFNDFRVQTGTGTIETRAVFPNPNRSLLPGQFARLVLHGATRPNAVLVPQAAVLSGQKGKFVFVVNGDGKTEARSIQTGDWRGDRFIVTSGLKPGERVVTSEVLKLQPGMAVNAVEPPPESRPGAADAEKPAERRRVN